ncbi:class A beta-lactamase [Aquamicrobium sp. LC103]|uniref:class A beta-lactamase n=1 Tax=Aquamicrobium sp. LC103 TaxID=1120658 RepID=UPI00063EA915|nr:class A beta-lactamase [Aquamicrobium sp. LC103]TKT77400.1 class A beta-lactamase [Aquamicrobium sp. LC103]
MAISITRRGLLAASIFAPAIISARTASAGTGELADRLRDIETAAGGRLGVAILDTGNGVRVEHRAHERFAMCSTFKFLAAACVLARVDRGEEQLDRRVTFAKDDLVTWSPVTEKHAGDGMTMTQLCHAAVTVSDNTAGNLLLTSFGGPAGLTAFARSLGDELTRLDRIEPGLNEATKGDPRDTTTPAAMLGNLDRTVLGDALSPASRDRLGAWLRANTTGDKRLKAGLPAGWTIGDKTGTGGNGATNDVGVIWPPEHAPIIVSAYLAETTIAPEKREAALREVGRIAASLRSS